MTNLELASSGVLEIFTGGYIRITQKRVTYIKYLIHKGIDVLFTDNDIVLLDDPFKHFHGDFDIYAQPEFPEDSNRTSYCPGFHFMRATNSSKVFLTNWKKNLAKDKNGDQRAFVLASQESDIKFKPLPSQQFSSGYVFFLSKIHWSKREPHLVQMHANFRKGYTGKLATLKTAGLWFMNGTTCLSLQ